MLNLVKEALKQSSVCDARPAVITNVIISTGDAVVVEVDCAKAGLFHVKCSQYLNLRNEFACYQRAFANFPTFVPEPVACLDLAGWSIMIARSVEHRPMRARNLAGSALLQRRRWILDFFAAASRTGRSPDTDTSHETLVATLHDFIYMVSGIDSPQLQYLRGLQTAEWTDLPEIPQHGDFSLNNLGRKYRGVVIFDWEDYGATHLPGFDICILALSISGLNPDFSRALHRGHEVRHPGFDLARQACLSSSLDFDRFRRLVPLYLLVFRYLKRNYSQRSREVADKLFLAAIN